ncbi:hypothetical protein [Marinicella sp. W31]|uniref:hypothetical protein n=1 Tax=Marinicella sp. W31 TaxID=3023713 RepID=UPI00375834EA
MKFFLLLIIGSLISPFQARSFKHEEVLIMQPHLQMMSSGKLLVRNNDIEVITVGIDSDCDVQFGSIQEAIDYSPDEVRIAGDSTYYENLVIEDKTIKLLAGFENCQYARRGYQQDQYKVVIDGGFSGSVISVFNSGSTSIQHKVVLENLVLTQGKNQISGGGLSAFNTDAEIVLRNVDIENNRAESGGGIALEGPVTLTAEDVKITRNQARFSGGGIHCSDTASILLFGSQSSISQNKLDKDYTGNGGGLHLTNRCTFVMRDGASEDNPMGGIVYNEAHRGGGVYISGGAKAFLYGYEACFVHPVRYCIGSNKSSANVNHNSANHGGGIYIKDFSSLFYMDTGEISFNKTSGGGTIEAHRSSSVILTWDDVPQGTSFLPVSTSQGPEDCWNPGDCLLIKGNEANHGGVFRILDSNVRVNRASIEDQRANSALIAIVVDQDDRNRGLIIENSLITHNGRPGLDEYYDQGLFYVTRADFYLINSTIADNVATERINEFVDPVALIENIKGNIFIDSSIISNPDGADIYRRGNSTQGYIPHSVQFVCSVVHETNSIPNASQYDLYLADPKFVNRYTRDYRLLHDSPAIDLCPDNSFFTFPNGHQIDDNRDLQLTLRPIDIPIIGDITRTVLDAGAYEFDDSVDY